MSDTEDFRIVASEPGQEKPPIKGTSPNNADTSGFGLINWMFDHIKDRDPIFLSLLQAYDEDLKILGEYRWARGIVVPIVLLFDAIIFLVYAAAIIAVIAGITFIFIKGTGLLDYVHPTTQPITTTSQQSQTTQPTKK